ncbi:MAG: hypothetical protein NTV70_23595 [Acidobacteria bacterium]|nr:hypothetical protein [Acidobacteriota bacterium]
MPLLLLLLGLAASGWAAEPTVHVVLWFDTEDYITPEDDDACLRLARDLKARGVTATFKIVGEKARVLEQRKRFDVIQALKGHDIAYHSDNHSIPPTPAVYLKPLSMAEGATEFMLREGPGARDVMRIFGVKVLSTYGQPGSSWGPQSHAALKQLGIPSYVDEGRHVGLNNQPFWYGGMFWMFNLGPNAIRVDINDPAKLEPTLAKAAERVVELQKAGGGVLHFWYHPNEFVTTEFWDGVNFSRGANPARANWKPAKLRNKEISEQTYQILNTYVEKLQKLPGVRFTSVRELITHYQPAAPPALAPEKARAFLAAGLTWHEKWSAAELVAAALGVPGEVASPAARHQSTLKRAEITRVELETAMAQAKRHIREKRQLPAQVWVDSDTLSIGDFVATMAQAPDGAGAVPVRRAVLAFEQYVATDACRHYNWVIHPEGFCAPELYDLGRLEAWTIKPATLKAAGMRQSR